MAKTGGAKTGGAKTGGKIASFFWWTYPRGSLEYDVMVGIILGFIFLTPRGFFRDQPRAGRPQASPFARLAPTAAPVWARNLTPEAMPPRPPAPERA